MHRVWRTVSWCNSCDDSGQDERWSSVPLHCWKLFHTCPLCLHAGEVREDCRPETKVVEKIATMFAQMRLMSMRVLWTVMLALQLPQVLRLQSHLLVCPNQMVKLRQSWAFSSETPLSSLRSSSLKKSIIVLGGSGHPNFMNPFENSKSFLDKLFPKKIWNPNPNQILNS